MMPGSSFVAHRGPTHCIENSWKDLTQIAAEGDGVVECRQQLFVFLYDRN